MTVRIVEHYKLERLLGEGGIGRVYAARDQELERSVAVKELRPELSADHSFAARFRAEATSLARLTHPNITTLYSLVRRNRELFMVMELVHGETLETILARLQRLSTDETFAIIAQITAGLSYAHQKGVIHRDIKPGNLMITSSGQVKIMDFGIARVEGAKRLTRHGSIVGTPAYLAPEQIKGLPGDARSDQYSLACITYEMLTGFPPFNAQQEFELLQCHVGVTPPPLAASLPGVDARIDRAISRALAKNPQDRFASVLEFSRALGAMEHPESASLVCYKMLLRAGRPSPPATRLVVREGSANPTSPQSNAAGMATQPPSRLAIWTSLRNRGRRRRLSVDTTIIGGLGVLLVGMGFLLLPSFSLPERRVPGAQSGWHGAMIPVDVAAKITPEDSPSLSADRLTGRSSDVGSFNGTNTDPLGQSASTLISREPGRRGTESRPTSMIEPAFGDANSAVPPKATPSALISSAVSGAPKDAIVKGRVDSYSPEGWPLIDGQPMRLFGIQPVPLSMQRWLVSFIAEHGAYLECEAKSGGTCQCFTQENFDIAQYLAANGWTKAPEDNILPMGDTEWKVRTTYADAEQQARRNKWGVWNPVWSGR